LGAGRGIGLPFFLLAGLAEGIIFLPRDEKEANRYAIRLGFTQTSSA
jgi:hypothetical protein